MNAWIYRKQECFKCEIKIVLVKILFTQKVDYIYKSYERNNFKLLMESTGILAFYSELQKKKKSTVNVKNFRAYTISEMIAFHL